MMGGPPQLVVLILVNGLPGAMLAEIMPEIKAASKSLGTHKRRELYWQAYSKLGNKAMSSMEEVMHGLLTFHLPEDSEDADEGVAAYHPCTKRQRGQLNATEIMGKKFKAPDPDVFPKGWASCWFDESAQVALDDLMFGEPVIYLSQDMDGVFVGSRIKRRKVRAAPSNQIKNVADADAFIASLQPDNPLQSISWLDGDVPKVNEYNFIFAGKVAKPIADATNFACVPSASTDDIYACFEQRRNRHFLVGADKLIAHMLTEIGKEEKNPICNVSMKLAGIARRNGLLKKVYVDSTKVKFIAAVKADGGGVEMYVIKDAPAESRFMEYGGVVFEMHYRADLALFGG